MSNFMTGFCAYWWSCTCGDTFSGGDILVDPTDGRGHVCVCVCVALPLIRDSHKKTLYSIKTLFVCFFELLNEK